MMKPIRFLLTLLGTAALLLATPACEMQSAAVTVKGYAKEQKEKSASDDSPEPANPAPPKYFSE